jgi:cystathionine beta-lyase/cystathionine gamma-synthase
MNIHDIQKIADLCKDKGVLTTFDNTMPTPYLLNPVDFGIDLIIHSGTKFMAGHSDILLGFVSTNNEELYKDMKMINTRNKEVN